jgi:drug/metabolite transporter (DMT)-like permease
MAMMAFAGNSILCRLALDQTKIDPASFTTIRLISGALILWLLVKFRHLSKAQHLTGNGSWLSATALFIYAASFSFAYLSLPAATGALLLFGTVQASMIGYGLVKGERISVLQTFGLISALTGLTALFLPGTESPSLAGALLMTAAGIAWSIYSIRGKHTLTDAVSVTAGNFVRTIPMSIIMSIVFSGTYSLDALGVLYATTSGAIASGFGYAIWYAALPHLKAMTASSVQLSVPVITALGGAVFLNEEVTLRLVLASIAILGGIAIVIQTKRPTQN